MIFKIDIDVPGETAEQMNERENIFGEDLLFNYICDGPVDPIRGHWYKLPEALDNLGIKYAVVMRTFDHERGVRLWEGYMELYYEIADVNPLRNVLFDRHKDGSLRSAAGLRDYNRARYMKNLRYYQFGLWIPPKPERSAIEDEPARPVPPVAVAQQITAKVVLDDDDIMDAYMWAKEWVEKPIPPPSPAAGDTADTEPDLTKI